jgi:undecaprenyl-diphosphatase
VPRVERDGAPDVDVAVTHWINALAGQSAALDQLMIEVTTFGVPFMVLLVALQWWSKRPREYKRHVCVAAGLSFLLGLLLAQIMLLFVHRMRPYDAGVSHLIVAPTVDWSFPSDHAIASLAIVFAFALQGLRRWSFIFLALAALVCFSRIYVGMHYVSDILGGAGIALIAAYFVKWIYQADTKLDRMITRIF